MGQPPSVARTLARERVVSGHDFSRAVQSEETFYGMAESHPLTQCGRLQQIEARNTARQNRDDEHDVSPIVSRPKEFVSLVRIAAWEGACQSSENNFRGIMVQQAGIVVHVLNRRFYELTCFNIGGYAEHGLLCVGNSLNISRTHSKPQLVIAFASALLQAGRDVRAILGQVIALHSDAMLVFRRARQRKKREKKHDCNASHGVTSNGESSMKIGRPGLCSP